MLTSINCNEDSQHSTTSAPIAAAKPSTPINLRDMKTEQFSPCNESNNSQNMLEENSNNNNNNNGNNNSCLTKDASREGSSATSTSASASISRQNSSNNNNNNNMCAATVTAANTSSSPNNTSEHSNSNNSMLHENSADLMNELHSDKAAAAAASNNNNKKKSTAINKICANDEDAANKAANDKSCVSSSAKIATSNKMNPSFGSIKEESDVMSGLINVKKEDTGSPVMSPVGSCLDVLVNTNSSSVDCKTRMISPVKTEITNHADKTAATAASMNLEEPVMNNSNNESTSNDAANNFMLQQHSSMNLNASSTANSGSCMDYAQQQNHIFVFSTQLANKGAESVVSGQFPSIIAYHCTQPATKNFLEDFFMKNPMKMNKLQRQNALSMCNMPVGSNGGAGPPPWASSCKLTATHSQQQQQQQKSHATKLNYNEKKSHAAKMQQAAAAAAAASSSSFAENAETLSASDSNMLCWGDQDSTSEASAAMKMLDGIDALVSSAESHSAAAAAAAVNTTSKLLSGGVSLADVAAAAAADCGIPSLQGVKVPDENLTPQQRQHRQEQLAKLEKMNQFLFRETGVAGAGGGGGGNNDFNMPMQPGNKAMPGKMSSEVLLNMQAAAAAAAAAATGGAANNSHNTGMRNKNDNMPNDAISAAEHLINDNDLVGLQQQCSAVVGNKVACGGPSNFPANALSGNLLNCQTASEMNVGMGLMPSSPDAIAGFGGVGGNDITTKNMAGVAMQQTHDMSHSGVVPPVEWSKLQQQLFEERSKGNKAASADGANNARNMRTNMPGAAQTCMLGTSPSQQQQQQQQSINAASRNVQGPPPPYHTTQRCSSVPIATQSPNPASPNNPTSTLSLPSPCVAGALGLSSNSPNIDAATSMSTMSTAISSSTTANANNAALKHPGFPLQDASSPTNSNSNNNNMGSNGGMRSNRNNMNQFNSNPSTPLPSHMSPKDLENFNANSGNAAANADVKNARPSPQRNKSPMTNQSGNNSSNNTESASMDGRFLSDSPVGFSSHNTVGNMNFKPHGPLERQNSAPMPSTQFGRRTDNLPLNPNSSRNAQNKGAPSFDPISSLAQMSQQLTSCVSLNAGGVVGNNQVGMGSMGLGGNEMHSVMPGNVNINVESMAALDGGMDGHCVGPTGAGQGGMPPMGPHMNHMQFMSGVGSSCHMNSMMPAGMGQRLMNPKMCGGFNPNAGGGGMIREGPGPGAVSASGSFHGMLPSHRMMNRMPVNFGNFNVSPNVQVKASTPNTIQYMPVRPQHSNANSNNNNMRMPSLEFLQRYTNPQMAGSGNSGVTGGGVVMDNSVHMSQLNPNNANDGNKMMNNAAAVGVGNVSGGAGVGGGMSFFGNCNQMPMGMGSEEDMLGMHELGMNSHAAMIRGMRPMRHNSIGPGQSVQSINGPRMQAPGGNIVGMCSQFSGNPQDPMDSNETVAATAALYGPGMCGSNQMFPTAGHQKANKGIGGNLCQNLGGNNAGSSVSTSMPGELGAGVPQAGLNGAGMMPPGNVNMMSGNAPTVGMNSGGNNGNPNYKSFVGPTSNDLKYAQQYHSFQQQLYATSTRSQQQGSNAGAGMANTGNNAAFFINK